MHGEQAEKNVILLALGRPDEAVLFEQHLNRLFPDLLEIYRAPSGFDAMSLAMNRPQVVLLDQRLPDVMGLDMIEPIREQIGPENHLIFVSGTGKGGIRPGMRDEALKRGATALFARPIDINQFSETLKKLLFPKPPDHPNIHGLELLDLIQAYHMKRTDRTVRIFAPDGRVGSVYMFRGEVTHIECGAMQGFPAMLELMGWSEGDIKIWDACLSAERTNELPTQNLILDAARMMDEHSHGSQTVPTDIFGEEEETAEEFGGAFMEMEEEPPGAFPGIDVNELFPEDFDEEEQRKDDTTA